jgi:hypothetical protein
MIRVHLLPLPETDGTGRLCAARARAVAGGDMTASLAACPVPVLDLRAFCGPAAMPEGATGAPARDRSPGRPR